MNIGRTLFWFSDTSGRLYELGRDFFALGTLLNRLLNEQYDGKKIKFININFNTDAMYELHPLAVKDSYHYYGGHLNFDGVFDKEAFLQLSRTEQEHFVWKKGHEYLCEAAKSLKNDKLLDAADYAYTKGLTIDLNPDFKVLENEIAIQDQFFNAVIWINFKEGGMYSKFILEKNGEVFFEKPLNKLENNVSTFFIEMYKSISVDAKNIIIKGHKEAGCFPIKISIDNVLPPFSKVLA